MTEIDIEFRTEEKLIRIGGKCGETPENEVFIPIPVKTVCYDYAGSQRDTRANMLIVFNLDNVNDIRAMHPYKGFKHCLELPKNYVLVKMYLSNRGVPYLTIIIYRNNTLVKYRFEKKIDLGVIKDLLEYKSIPKEIMEKIIEAIREFFVL